MNTPILFYAPGTCSLASIVALEWWGEPYRLCRLDPETFGGEQYERINPLGQVPLLHLGDRLLGQNTAILNYIASQNRELKLAPPPATPEFHRFMEALGYVNSNFHASFGPIFMADTWSKNPAAQAEIKTNGTRLIRDQYAYIEEFLVPEGFLFGHPTVFDAYLFAIGRWAETFHLFDVKKDFPKVARFLEDFAQLPAAKFALAIEKDGNAQSSGAFQGHVELNGVLSKFGAGKLDHFKTLTSGRLLSGKPVSSEQSQAV